MHSSKKISISIVLMLAILMSMASISFGASPTPTGITVTPQSASLAVSWTASTGAESYNVYVGGVKKNVSPITTTNYTITGLTNGTAYSVQVSSYDELDTSESVLSTAVIGTPNVMIFSSFLADVTKIFQTVRDGIAVFMEPPLLWYVVLGFGAAAIGIAKRLVPKKKAK